jgi:hypothetical protein
MPDLSSRLTVFVSTIGDARNFTNCVRNLERQSTAFRLEYIRNVAPMSAAFQCMLDRCETDYYVQVDEDMHLFPDAVERLYSTIEAASPSIALVCGALWDHDVKHPIYGVKVYRHKVVRDFPYRDSFSCEKTQLSELRAAGYDAELLSLASRDDCFGEHGKYYDRRSIYVRWRRLMQKRVLYRDQPGRNTPWVDEWPKRLLERYMESRDPLHMYALFGAVAGLAAPLTEDREFDYRDPLPDLDLLMEYFEGVGFDPDRIPQNGSGRRSGLSGKEKPVAH